MKSTLLLLAGVVFAQEPIILVDNGQAKAAINAGDPEAARELVLYVEKVTGAKLSTGGNARVRVLVGSSVAPKDTLARLRSLGRDGYVIESRPGTIVLAGNGRAQASAPVTYRCSAPDKQFIATVSSNLTQLNYWSDALVSQLDLYPTICDVEKINKSLRKLGK